MNQSFICMWVCIGIALNAMYHGDSMGKVWFLILSVMFLISSIVS